MPVPGYGQNDDFWDLPVKSSPRLRAKCSADTNFSVSPLFFKQAFQIPRRIAKIAQTDIFVWCMHLLPRISDSKTGNRNFQISSERISRTGNRAVQNVGRSVCSKNFFCLLQNIFDKRRVNIRAIAGLSRQIRQLDVGVAVFSS